MPIGAADWEVGLNEILLLADEILLGLNGMLLGPGEILLRAHDTLPGVAERGGGVKYAVIWLFNVYLISPFTHFTHDGRTD